MRPSASVEAAATHASICGTFEGLDAARHLYEKNGFRLAEQQRGIQWGREVNEQRFVLPL
jgi:hypothetical protein